MKTGIIMSANAPGNESASIRDFAQMAEYSRLLDPHTSWTDEFRAGGRRVSVYDARRPGIEVENMAFLEREGAQIRYDIEGTGPTLILSAAYGTPGSLWGPLPSLL